MCSQLTCTKLRIHLIYIIVVFVNSCGIFGGMDEFVGSLTKCSHIPQILTLSEDITIVCV